MLRLYGGSGGSDDLRNLWAASTAKAAAYVATTLILGIGAAAAGLAAVS